MKEVDTGLPGDAERSFPDLAHFIPMDFDALQKSLRQDNPPADLDFALTALWWDAKGDWSKAHESAQQDEGPRGAWVHAYLHRKEGDTSNAAYWYRRAGRPAANGRVADEWREITVALLEM